MTVTRQSNIHIGLLEDDRLLWVYTSSEIILHHFDSIAAQRLGIPKGGERVIIHDHQVALMILVNVEKWLKGTKIVAEVQVARGLQAGEEYGLRHRKTIAH